MSELKCFKNEVIDWVIAETPEEATKILCESYGMEILEDSTIEEFSECWSEVDPSSNLFVYEEDTPSGRRQQTVSEWIKEKGKGFLCSTEY